MISMMPRIHFKTQWMAYLDTFYFPFTKEKLNFLRDLSTILAFLINFLFLYSYETIVRHSRVERQFGSLLVFDSTGGLIEFFVQLQEIAASLMLVYWILINIPDVVLGGWREEVEKNRSRLEE